jgi:arginine N-succinyltransferase
MIILRRVKADDLSSIYHFAQVGGYGLTSLPADKDLLSSKMTRALASFNKQVTVPQDEFYLFVLEDLQTKAILACCGIEGTINSQVPFYSFKLSTLLQISKSLNIRKQVQILSLVNDYQGSSELCSLFIDIPYRNQHLARQLSLSRFLFIAQFPERFADLIIAEMRGVSDEKGNSPFWRHLGKHFFGIKFSEADHLSALGKKQFIADLMPKYPVYVNLLHKKAVEVLGQPHESTKRAKILLEEQGFHFKGYLDIFDGGPTLEAHKNEILAVRKSKLVTLTAIDTIDDSNTYLISNSQLDFRCCRSSIKLSDKATITINQETAEALQVKIGDKLRILLL